MKIASEAKVDYVTFDGAGGGTGMSPVSMMNEMGTPTVYLESQVLRCIELLKKKGKHIPDISMAGGFINESQIFKSIAMSNFGNGPYVKAITMARAPITAVFKAAYYVELAEQGKLPHTFAERFGTDPSTFFITAQQLKKELGARFNDVPPAAIGLYTYLTDRIGVGLRQLMAGVRKWKLELIDRGDLTALTEHAAKVTGLSTPDEIEKDVVEQILG